MHSDCICCLYLLFLPPLSLSIDTETNASQEIDYTADDPAFAAKQPGKQNPLDACLYHLFFLPPACIRIWYCYCFIPYLMHSLFL